MSTGPGGPLFGGVWSLLHRELCGKLVGNAAARLMTPVFGPWLDDPVCLR